VFAGRGGVGEESPGIGEAPGRSQVGSRAQLQQKKKSHGSSHAIGELEDEHDQTAAERTKVRIELTA